MRLPNLSPIVLLALVSSLSAEARVVFTSGHWSLDDLSDASNPNAQCIMFSQEDNRGTVWRLEIAHAKGIASTTELQLRQQGRGPLSWTATLRSGKVLAFANLGKAGNADMIWNLPQGLSDIVYQLEVSEKPVELKPADGSRTSNVRFDEKGFGKVKAEMMKRCLNNGELVDVDFENSFFKDTGRTLDPNAVNAQTVSDLKGLLGQGYKLKLDLRANSSAQNALESRFSAQTSERTSLTDEISDLNARILPGLQQDQLNNNNLEAQNNALLSRMNALIPQQEAALARATDVRDRAQAAIAPFVDEHNARLDASDGAHRDANNASARIGEIDRSVGALNQRIGGLQVTRDNAIADARRLGMALPRARQEADMADQALRSFRLENEVHQRLDHDPRYAQLQAQFKPARAAADVADGRRAQAQRELDQRSRELVACARGGGAPAPAAPVGPAPGRNPDRPGRPRPGQPDTPAAPTEPAPAQDATGTPDCSAQTAAVQAAQANLDQAKRDADALAAQADGLNRSMDEIERNARRDAAAFQAKLQEDFNRAAQRFAAMAADAENARRTAENIDRVQIPQAQGQIYDLTSERTTRVAQLNAASSEAARQDNDLALFEQRVGWKAKSDALATASAALDARTRELASSRTSRANAQTGLANCAAERNRLTTLQAEKNALLQRDQDRLAVVNASLVPYDQEKARLNQVGSGLSGSFQDLSAQFDAKLPH